jgi:hypothetical protein
MKCDRAANEVAPLSQGALTDNDAALQQRVTVANNPFLATLSTPGQAQFLTAQKPCSILLPHNHQKASEFYTILFGMPPSHHSGVSCNTT